MSTRPYGTWASPITSARVSAGSLRLSQPRLDRGELFWLEGRPDEGGRQVVVGPGGDLTPAGMSAQTLAHEYGGGDYAVGDGVVVFSNLEDQRVYRMPVRGGVPEPLTAAGARYADFEIAPDGRWLVAVEERPREGGEPENRLVAISLQRSGPPRIVAAGHDFVSFPRFSPDGSELVFTSWEHPQMPWDGTELHRLDWGTDGPAGAPHQLAGGIAESIFQPGHSPVGRITFVSDRSGWWNLHQLRERGIVDLCPRPAEFGRPQWVFGLATWAFLDEETILCIVDGGGRECLARLDLASGRLEDLVLPFTSFGGLRVEGDRACFVAAAADRPSTICSFDTRTGALAEHRSSFSSDVDPRFLSLPTAIEFPTDGGINAHAQVYAPANASFSAARGERPPLLVKSHGGPTSAASPALDLRVQYWTSRGFAVADIDYRGSTGYGRAYRELLRGAWGVADVADCVNAATFLADRGQVDARRLAISGGSAGGYTTLCALTFHDRFAAGASHYGIGDLEALTRDTHKFESRYLDGLVGPYPERRDLYVERSPIHFCDRLSCPIIFFQGLEDRVVPPSQAEAMVAALVERGIPHAYVTFEGERHGFRRAENQRTALDGELFFYSWVFGFEVDVRPDRVRIVAGTSV